MSEAALNEALFQTLAGLIARDVFQRGTAPLKNGTEINIYLDQKGPVALVRQDGQTKLVASASAKPDMTYWAPPKAIEALAGNSTEDIGEMGVEILKLMANPDPAFKITVKVHIGLFDFLTRGYLGILPLGGQTVMRYLSSKGLDGIGKIKDAISSLRG